MKDLDELQGAWNIVELEMDGRAVQGAAQIGAKIEIRGEAFRTTGMGAVYEGTVVLNSKARPRTLDMVFTAGPEKGNTNFGIYELSGDIWRICISTRGPARPMTFKTLPGTGQALEVLRRGAASAQASAEQAAAYFHVVNFKPVPELEGEWSMVSGKLSGESIDKRMLKSGRRVVEGCETSVFFGPQLYAKAKVTVEKTQAPFSIDYYNTAGPSAGQKQLGIYELKNGTLTLCLAPTGGARPEKFDSTPGDGKTFVVWRRK